MVFKTLLILVVIAVLMEDSLSIKKSPEEEKEEREMAEKVNATLAEEEKKRQEENEKKEDEKEKKPDQEKKKTEKEKRKQDKSVEKPEDQEEVQDEAGPSLNCSCPTVKPCKPCEDCPVANCSGQGEACPEVKPCPKCKDPEEPEECPPVLPCPVVNRTSPSVPDGCPESSNQPMSVPVAMAVGATASLLVTGVAAAIGLLLRYASPIVSGFVFLASLILMWYLSSHHPETARELGGRAATLLREAAVALGHRMMAAIQRHQEQVSVPSKLIFLF
jgi:hypothetical protein